MASFGGSSMYCTMSARSTNAVSCWILDKVYKEWISYSPIAFTRLLVAMTSTFFLCLSLSSCVRRAFTTWEEYSQRRSEGTGKKNYTLKASDGSAPDIAPARAAVNDSTSSDERHEWFYILVLILQKKYLWGQWRKYLRPQPFPLHLQTIVGQVSLIQRTILKTASENWFQVNENGDIWK